jgi:hypothetical protein
MLSPSASPQPPDLHEAMWWDNSDPRNPLMMIIITMMMPQAGGLQTSRHAVNSAGLMA